MPCALRAPPKAPASRRRQDKTHLQLLHSKRIKWYHRHHVTQAREARPERACAAPRPIIPRVRRSWSSFARSPERGELPFRGQAFYDRAPEGVPLPSNLRTLVTYNILEKVGPSTARGAYYKVTDLV